MSGERSHQLVTTDRNGQQPAPELRHCAPVHVMRMKRKYVNFIICHESCIFAQTFVTIRKQDIECARDEYSSNCLSYHNVATCHKMAGGRNLRGKTHSLSSAQRSDQSRLWIGAHVCLSAERVMYMSSSHPCLHGTQLTNDETHHNYGKKDLLGSMGIWSWNQWGVTSIV